MQVLNSACAYADNEYHSTIEAFFEGAWDEATDHRPFLTSLLYPPSPSHQPLWLEKSLVCKTICIAVCTLNPPYSCMHSLNNFFSFKYSIYTTLQISHIHVLGPEHYKYGCVVECGDFFAQFVIKSSK